MACKYCGKKTRKVVTATYKGDTPDNQNHYIICNNCKNVLHRPPSHIPADQHRKYLEKVITKNDDT